MLEPTKKLHTDVELRFLGPVMKKADAIKALRNLGFVNTESIPWRESFPEFNENEAGTCLAGIRYREELKQHEVAKRTGIPQRHISEMENGKRTIGKKNAKLLAKVFNVDYRLFL